MTPHFTIRIFATLFTLIFSTSLFADQFPARYSVTDVAANDSLNIRAEPNGSAEILGTYPPYAVNIEVLRLTDNGKWARVGLGEGNGWVAARFLSRDAVTEPYRIPRPLTCVGTEPFWSFNMSIRGTDFSEAGYDLAILNEVSEAVTDNAYLGVFEEGPTLTHTMLVQREMCGDGMSDREFGFSARLFVNAPDGNRFYRGCCTMEQNR